MGKKKKLKVVIDTNVFLSFFLTSGQTISNIFDLWKNNKFKVYTSSLIEKEILAVFNYQKIKRLINKDQLALAKHLIKYASIKLEPSKKVFKCKDPKDNVFLEICNEIRADYLITGDKKHLLPLKKFKKTKIVSPKEFIELTHNARF